ncbi:MAG: glycosyltransferase [Vicinamibacterales bacterium]
MSRPVVDMGTEAHRRARLFGFLAGVRDGLRLPVDRSTGLFRAPSASHTAPSSASAAASVADEPVTPLDAIITDRSPGVLARSDAPPVERVSIVLPNWNARPFLVRALDALVTRTTFPYELIVVDNGSTDGSKDYIRDFLRRHPELDATFIDNEENRYFSTACNQGFQAASPSSKYLALYCNDVEARSDTWLQDLIEAVQPEDVIASGQAALKPVTDRYRGVFSSYDPQYATPDLSARMAAIVGRSDPVMHLYGYCFLLKRSLVEKTGLYLHTGPFTQYHSDWEWYLRWAAMGYRIAPIELKVHHWHSISELLAFYPDQYRDLVDRLDDPAAVERYLETGRPLYDVESGFREKYPTAWARWSARVLRHLGRA